MSTNVVDRTKCRYLLIASAQLLAICPAVVRLPVSDLITLDLCDLGTVPLVHGCGCAGMLDGPAMAITGRGKVGTGDWGEGGVVEVGEWGKGVEA